MNHTRRDKRKRNQSEEMYSNSPRLEAQMYTRHGRSPLSSEHLRQLDCLYDAYNQECNSEGDRRFYWAKIQQLTNSLTE